MTRPQRLAEYFHRLGNQQPSTTAEDAFARVTRTLLEVEDEHSGLPRSVPPPPPHKSDGRMYPPLDDYVKRLPDGGILALTKGHDIRIGRDGTITMTDRTNGQVEFQQFGAGV